MMRLVLDLVGSGYGFIFEFGRARWDLLWSSALLRLKRGLILPDSPSLSVPREAAHFCSKSKIQARTFLSATGQSYAKADKNVRAPALFRTLHPEPHLADYFELR
jgi:hypothetical protein